MIVTINGVNRSVTLSRLIELAKAEDARLTPAQREATREAQRQSWARSCVTVDR